MARLGLLLCVVLFTHSAAAAYLAKSLDMKNCQQLRARAGNESAGSDIYGIGVRVGFYLQGIAFTVNAFTAETRKGMLLAATSVQAAILASLSVLVSHNSISPAEMLIILDMIAFSALPAVLALLTIDSGGQGLGITLFVIDSIWAAVLNTWLWAKGYRTLPLLGTSNAGFFYTRVQIDGWFRIFNLVLISMSWLMQIGVIVLGAHLLTRAFKYFGDEDEDYKESKFLDFVRPAIPWVALGTLIFTVPLLVVAAEKMIQWNGLSPDTNISAPGQVIPFAIGIVSICDATVGALRHLITKG